MKILILAGGYGKRLRPLTERVPKPLVPLVDRPLIEHVLEWLPRDEVIITVSYMRNLIEDYISTRNDRDRFTVVEEKEPMDTGGAIKNAAPLLKDGPFMVINGDILTDFDVKPMIEFHEKKGGTGTMAIMHADDPSRFGTVKLKGNRIVRFVEKPFVNPPSNWVNAGIYIFEPEIFKFIPDGKVSLEKKVFKSVARMRLFGYKFKAFWIDAGTLPSYLRATDYILGKYVDEGKIERKVLIGDADVYGEVHPPCVIQDGVHIGEKSYVKNAMIMENAFIGDDVFVESSIIGPGMKLGRGQHVVADIYCPWEGSPRMKDRY